MCSHEHVAGGLVSYEPFHKVEVLDAPGRVKMRVGFVEEEERFVLPGEAQQPQNHQELLFAFTHIAKGERICHTTPLEAYSHFTEDARNIGTFKCFKKCLLIVILRKKFFYSLFIF